MEGGTICNNTVDMFTGEMLRDSTHAKPASAYGGGVYVDGEFTMSGGTICNNTAQTRNRNGADTVASGAGVFVSSDGKCVLNGGTISGNTASTHGGGVYALGTLEISGGPVVKDNVEGAVKDANGVFTGGTTSNVYLPSGKTLTVTGALDENASVGVCMEAAGVFAQAANDYNEGRLADAAHFTSDSADCTVGLDNGKAKLTVLPVTVTFDANGGTGTMKNVSAARGGGYTLPACGFTAPTGKQFKEWSVKIGDAGAVTKAAGDTITAAANVTLTATWEDVPVESVTLNKPTLGLTVGGSGTLIATVQPENAADKRVTWSSDAENVAKVDENGKVTGIAAGQATITATTTDGGFTATCAVTVGVETVETPVLPAAGSFSGSKSIAITCATDNVTIYYTTDGSTPMTTSTKYTGPFTVSATTTVKAIAVCDGMADSEVVSATYTYQSSSDDSSDRRSSDHSSSSNSSSTNSSTTTTNPDGSKAESKSNTTTTKNTDGSTTAKTTETATTTAQDGSKTETKAETSTTTKANNDGTTTATTMATETATAKDANGKTTTVTETKVEAKETLDKSGNGTVEGKTTETVKDASGKVTETTVTESKGTVETAADGTKTTTTTNTAVTTNAATGDQTTVVTTEKAIEAADGSKGSTVTDASGKTVAAEVTVSEKAVSEAAAKNETVTLPVEVKVTDSRENAAPVAVTLPSGSDKVTVEIPVENITAGTVAVIVKADGTEEIVKTSTNGENGVKLTLDGSATVKIVDNTKTFSDVKDGDWFADNAAWAASHEIMNGMGDGTFAANEPTTQGMMEQILFNIDGNELTAPAEGEDWWTAADNWAANGVTAGLAAHDPAAPATREADVLMMYNYAKAKGYDVSARADLSTFSDADSVSDEAKEAMAWAVAMGVINGTKDANGNVILDAQGIATRGQIAAIVERFCKNVMK